MPDEEWLAGPFGLIHEAAAVLDQHLVKCLHVVFGWAAYLKSLAPHHVWEWC